MMKKKELVRGSDVQDSEWSSLFRVKVLYICRGECERNRERRKRDSDRGSGSDSDSDNETDIRVK